jgi:hypothetical protein
LVVVQKQEEVVHKLLGEGVFDILQLGVAVQLQLEAVVDKLVVVVDKLGAVVVVEDNRFVGILQGLQVVSSQQGELLLLLWTQRR